MRFRNLLTASVAALAVTAMSVPATAQGVSGQVTIGVNHDNNHNRHYDNRYGNNDRGHHGQRYVNHNNTWSTAGAFLTFPLGAQHYYAGTCGSNRVEIRFSGLETGRGRVVLVRNFGNNNFYMGERLVGKSFWPTAGRVCVKYRDINSGRTLFVHDVNNNGVVDFRDGIGRVSYGASVGYGRQVVNINFDYGYGSRY